MNRTAALLGLFIPRFTACDSDAGASVTADTTGFPSLVSQSGCTSCWQRTTTFWLVIALFVIMTGCSGAPSEPPPAEPPPLASGPCGVPDLVAHNCAPASPSHKRGVALERAFPKLQVPQNPACGPNNILPTPCGGPFRPTSLVQHPVDRNWYLVEQPGRILRFSETDAEATVVLDIADQVVFGFEPGLLNLAFDPASPNDAYLWYTSCRPTPGDDSARCFEQAERRSGVDQALYIVLSRMVRGDDGVFDPDSEQVLLAITSEPNHFGHGPLFGPDGMLYVGIGDGREVGASGPRDSSRLQGKILRLDVHGEDGKRLVDPPYYRVPNNNPYVGKPGARAEIFASGLRNPWRMAIDNQDPVTLLLGDVGDATMEEINRVKAGSDLGWPAMEGNECRNPDRLDAMTVKRPCVPPSGVTAPIHAYHHSQGISVTGGVVYRGKGIPELSGAYLFTDFLRGALTRIDPGQAPRRILDLDIMVTNFATDLEGEVYLTDFVTGGIFRLVAAETGAPPPVSLRKTGCVDMAHPTRPAPGGIPFDIGVPAFTEPGVSASRTLFLPADQKVERTAEGLELPRGSVIVQHHSRESQPIETRLLSLHEDGGWTGWAYQWHDGEATRVDTAIDVDIDPIRWHHPAPGECMDCHREGTLGMTPAQLGSGTLQTLECLGRFDGDTETAPLPSDSAPVEERLAAYLSVNCGHCHVPGFPGGRARGYFILANNGFRSACGVGPQMAVYDDPDSRILVPGNPDHSLLLRRLMESELPYRMPPYRHGVDPVGTGLVRAWLADAPPCGGR